MNYKTEVIIVLLIIAIPFVIANTIIDNSQSEFDLGTYTNTQYNTDHIELNTGQTSGTYTSQIFNANSSATWNNISWENNLPNQENIYIVDGQKYVFSSTNSINWTTKSTDYGGTNSPGGLVSASSGELILLNSKDIYLSSNYGINWTKINDKFTTQSNDGKVMTIDSNDNIYIVDGVGRVFKSINLGYNWTEINSDFNTETNNAKGLTVNSTDSLFAVDGAGDVYSSSDSGVTWTYLSDYGGGSYTDGITADQNDYLYILLDKDIYRSIDSGLTWTKINDRFTPYTNNGLLLFFDKKDSLIIADGIGRIFKSSNLGLNWTEFGDCNGAASNDPKVGTTAIYDTSIDISVRSCDDSNCDTEIFTDITDTSPQDLSITSNQYFQYKFNFETNNPNYSPELNSVTISYNVTIELCEEDWICTDWDSCTNSTQTRICTDQNLCGTGLNKPIELQNCTENPGGGSGGGSGGGGSAPSSIYQSSKTEQSAPEISEQEPISNTNEQNNKQPETQNSQGTITSYTVKQPSFLNKNLKHIITAITMAILAVYIFRKQVKHL